MSDELEQTNQTADSGDESVTPEVTSARRGRRPQVQPPVEDTSKEQATPVKNGCKEHPSVEGVLYGYCLACYAALPTSTKRELYLKARLEGVNAHNYPHPCQQAWREELVAIKAGIWKAPRKIRSKNRTVGEILG